MIYRTSYSGVKRDPSHYGIGVFLVYMYGRLVVLVSCVYYNMDTRNRRRTANRDYSLPTFAQSPVCSEDWTRVTSGMNYTCHSTTHCMELVSASGFRPARPDNDDRMKDGTDCTQHA